MGRSKDRKHVRDAAPLPAVATMMGNQGHHLPVRHCLMMVMAKHSRMIIDWNLGPATEQPHA